MSEALDLVEIGEADKALILNTQEGHFFEVKSKEVKPAKLTETLSAFANASGGDLYIGIDEIKAKFKKRRKWNGFPNQESANGHIQALETLFPLGSNFSYDFLRCPSCTGFVLKVGVNKVADIKQASNGTIYVRRGAQNIEVLSIGV